MKKLIMCLAFAVGCSEYNITTESDDAEMDYSTADTFDSCAVACDMLDECTTDVEITDQHEWFCSDSCTDGRILYGTAERFSISACATTFYLWGDHCEKFIDCVSKVKG